MAAAPALDIEKRPGPNFHPALDATQPPAPIKVGIRVIDLDRGDHEVILHPALPFARLTDTLNLPPIYWTPTLS